MRARPLLVIAFLALLCALCFVAQVHWRPAQFVLSAEVRTEAPAWLQLRYNRGYGNRQEGIAKRIVEKTGEFVRLRFPIEVNDAQGLRLVNLGFGRSFDIRSLTIKPLGGTSRTLTAAELSPNTPNKAETKIQQIGDIIHVETSGVEPLVLHIEQGTRAKASRIALVLQWIFLIPLSLAALGLIWALSRGARGGIQGELNPVGPDSSRWRTRVVLAIGVAYLVSSGLDLNGSSTALWRYYADREMPTAGVLLASPQEVRSDEWMLQTPWIFSQARRTPAFSAVNPNIGSDVTPLVTNLPVRHWTTIFRPQMWPFFLLNPERAFAFYWNFKSFGLLLGAFLFFGTLTGGKTLLDLAGAVFLTFSPFVQWWLSTPTCLPEMLAMFSFALWLCSIVFRAQARWRIVAAAAGLVVAVENFIFCCYPRFQIPLAYLAAALLLGGFIVRRKPDQLGLLRLSGMAVVIIAIGFLTWRWWLDVAEIVRITSLLSYPGQIRYSGGGFEWNRFFDPFLEFSMAGDHFPERLENACEAAGFLFLGPILAVLGVRDAWRGNADRMVLIPLAIAAVAIFYMTIGLPMWAARLSGWSHVYEGRANLVIGVATAIALVRYLARRETGRSGLSAYLLIFGGSFLLLIPILNLTNMRLGHFEASSTIVITAISFGLVVLCLWLRSALATCILLLLPQFYACALINPVTRGLPGITESRLFHWVEQAHNNKPAGHWIVLGETLRAQMLPDLIKATGANVLGGMRCNPDHAMLEVLDPARNYLSLTDRYAWIHFRRSDLETPVLEAAAGLGYDIKIPLSRPLLDRLDVKHILEVDLPADQNVPSGFHLLGARDGCRLLERD